ncbi:hypothetical protein SNOG_04601 [Parastagonospora nodorum SN15]|uniref:Uncharacterized protein n=1 Tax=Phaeosphaeria nodorum (strain SN15 / ATCC MYA-4574 / FGSC 10173) TaxID=321614 RepID=Q0UUG3_PHANO|nr:hypothetical protein SNOG_04601 [Parastagonospora nodorum SN15]EAT88361.1 hypothetical protein SNOG_04601 [Parastagonospora nodorum SN15]
MTSASCAPGEERFLFLVTTVDAGSLFSLDLPCRLPLTALMRTLATPRVVRCDEHDGGHGSHTNDYQHELQHFRICHPDPLPTVWRLGTWQRISSSSTIPIASQFTPQFIHPCCSNYPRLSHITEWGAPKKELTPRSSLMFVTQCSSGSLLLVVHSALRSHQSRFLGPIDDHCGELYVMLQNPSMTPVDVP